MPERKPISKQFYVYVLRDPRHGRNMQPIYVGKGKRYRAGFHWRHSEDHDNSLLRRVFGKITKAGLKPIVEIECRFNDEADAFRKEKELIAEYGRRNLGLGPLCNLTDGGEGTTGWLATEEFREYARKRNRKRWANPDNRRKQAEHMRKHFTDPQFKKVAVEHLRRTAGDPKVVKARIEGLQKRFADPEFTKTHAERMRKLAANPSPAQIQSRRFPTDKARKARAHNLRKLHADPNFREAHIERLQKRNADPEFKKASTERLRAAVIKRNADPDVKAANATFMRKLNADPEFKKAASDRMRKMNKKDNANRTRERWTDPSYKARMSAAFSKAWIKRRADKEKAQ